MKFTTIFSGVAVTLLSMSTQAEEVTPPSLLSSNSVLAPRDPLPHGKCDFHATVTQICEPIFHTYGHIPRVRNAGNNFPLDIKDSELGPWPKEGWYVLPMWDWNLTMNYRYAEKGDWAMFTYDKCTWKAVAGQQTGAGTCGRCKAGDWTTNLAPCVKPTNPTRRVSAQM